MTAALLLWGHALAALGFAGLAIDRAERPADGWPKATLTLALGVTAVWALAVAGIDARDIATRIAAGLRDLAWLAFLFVGMRREVRTDRRLGVSLALLYAAVAAMAVAGIALALVATLPLGAESHAAVADARSACRTMGAIGALLLLHHVQGSASVATRTRLAPLAAALALMWGADLAVSAAAFLTGAWPQPLGALRGLLMIAAAALTGIAVRRPGDWRFTLSRTATTRSLAAAALLAYAAATVALTMAAEAWAGGWARAAQTGIVAGAAVALATLVSTPWLKAWAKVKIAKHLFRHRYDYRTEWQRFTTTLGVAGADADPLEARVVKALADLVDAPAGLLLIADAERFVRGADWRWDGAGGEGEGGAGPDLMQHLAETGRIVALDEVRGGTAPAPECAAVPSWVLASDAWAIVPLPHGQALVGAILLARPPVDRALDWEDLDLLRIAGRQAASYLAEERAHAALAEAARFDEFNRRFAFVVHDIKNLVSGLTLVARNAERHADNPEFRTDMIHSLRDSVARMNALLARLAQHHRAEPEAAAPVDLGALARRLAASARARHPVTTQGEGLAFAPPQRLEQALTHLVQNAIDASPPDMPVTLSVSPDAGGIAVEVADRGCGMSPGFVRDRLFRPFASTKPGGFGIGAYEARELVTGMGATIRVESDEGAGSRFRIVLPAAPGVELAA